MKEQCYSLNFCHFAWALLTIQTVTHLLLDHPALPPLHWVAHSIGVEGAVHGLVLLLLKLDHVH